MNKFLKSSLVYFLGSTFNKILYFFLLPLYTNYLSPSTYGYYDLSVNYVNLFTIILFFDIGVTAMRFLFESKDKEETITNTTAVFIISVLLYIICFSIFNCFVKIEYFILVLIYGIIYAMNTYCGYITRAFSENITYAISGCISTLIILLINIIAIVIFKIPYYILYISSIIGLLVQISIMVKKIKINEYIKRIKINKKYISKIYKYSLPLCVNSVAYWLLTGFNRIIISNYLNVTENGYYAVAEKFSLIINLVGTCFTLAWQEMAFKKSTETSETSEFYTNATNLYIKFIFCALIIFIPCIYIVFPYIIGKQYIVAKSLIPLAILSSSISLLSTFLGNIFNAEKKTNKVFYSMVASSIFNIILILCLINKMGVKAANLSLCLSFLLNTSIRLIMLNKIINLKIDIKKIIFYCIIILAYMYVYESNSIYMNLIFLVIGFIICFCLLKEYFYNIIKSMFSKRKKEANGNM